MKTSIRLWAAVILTATALHPAYSAGAKPSPKSQQNTGVLECKVGGGAGLLLGSQKEMTCTFAHKEGGTENYHGKINKIGLDIGITSESTIIWAVAPTGANKLGSYALEGEYVGTSAGGSLGLGFGANVLVGGSNKSVALQPLSLEGTKGVNLAIGLSRITLERVQAPEQKKRKKK